MKFFFVKIQLIFDIENGFENQNLAIFDLQYQIKPNTWNLFMAEIIDIWLLNSAKLSCSSEVTLLRPSLEGHHAATYKHYIE